MQLCPPAKLYLVISVIALVVMLFQNAGGHQNSYCLGIYSCDYINTGLIFIFKIAFIVLWTFILNLFCENNLSILSWVFVLFPFLLLFIIIASAMTFGTNNYLYSLGS